MNRTLRIGLFCVPRLVHGGGFEEYLIALANSLTARGHHVSIVNASPKQYRALNIVLNVYYGNPLLHDNSRATPADVYARLDGAELHELPMWKMARVLRRCNVIYAKNELLDLSVLRMLGMARLPPIICGIHTPLWYPRALSPQAQLHNKLYLGHAYRALLAGTTAVHVLNSEDAALLPRVHRWPADRIVHIPPSYAANAEQPAPRAASDGRLRVLWGARMTEQKGVDTLVNIIDKLNDSSAPGDFVFMIAGSGDPPLEVQVASAAERHRNVRYLGYVPHDEMQQLYDDADVALVTSNWETFGYSCLEPQSRGVPVVASRIPGCTDIVEHDVTGFLFPPGDVDAAVVAMKQLLDLRRHHPVEFETMRRRTLSRIQEHFNPTRINDSLERMMRTVARGGTLAGVS